MPTIVTDNGLELINLGANDFDYEGADRGPDVWRKFNDDMTTIDTNLTELNRLTGLVNKLKDAGITDGFINGGLA